jgi:hypothetical protein
MSSAPGWPSPPDPERRRIERAFVAVVCERGLDDPESISRTTAEAIGELQMAPPERPAGECEAAA